jgi:hypothetical protein
VIGDEEATADNASAITIVAAKGMPIFFRLPDIIPHQPLINDVNTHFAIIIQK